MKSLLKYGLIGRSLKHTFSPKYFAKKFARENISADYQAYELEEAGRLLELFDQGLIGINVTIPYKESVIPFLDDLSLEAAEIGAVNTIKKTSNGLKGYNTDVYGFKNSMLALNLPFSIDNARALILGTGGASKAVLWVMKSLDIDYKLASRNSGDILYSDLDKDLLSSFDIIVNTTPLGMYPYEGQMPDLPVHGLHDKQLVYDLIYNPEKTVLLELAEQRGATIKNGSEMLVLQAERSWEIWNSPEVD